MIVCGLLAAAGCEGPSAEFVLSERTQQLDRTARTQVAKTLDENFGTPQKLVALEQLPIDYGGIPGTVNSFVKADPEAKTVTLAVQLEDDEVSPALAGPGDKLTWFTGDYAGATQNVKGYDATTGEITLFPDMETPPAKGESFVINFGAVLAHGRKLYAVHCMHCHGVSGDGNGPTAQYLNPRPRDYRLGKFKFTSTLSPEKATREDLKRTILNGIPGTYMPSFLLLKPDEVNALVEYVRFLSMRGEMEKRLVDDLSNNFSKDAIADREKGGESSEDIEADLNSYLESDYLEYAEEVAQELANAWNRAELPESLVLPKVPRTEDTLASRMHGRELFLDDQKSKCVTCHGPTGRGDGSQTEAFQENPVTRTKYPEPGLYDDWGRELDPRNLNAGIYRGGRRPIDLYRRIYAGIKGTPMPSFGTVLTDEDIWDVVNYVMSIPFDGPWPDSKHGMPAAVEPVTTAQTESSDSEH